MKTLPKELQEYIDKLPSASINNSRSIMRSYFQKALTKHPNTAMRMLEKYGLYTICDYSPHDDGNEILKGN